MRILFNTIRAKRNYIEDHSTYDEEQDMDFYFCPACHTQYEDIDDAMDCCVCSKEELYDGDEDEDY